MFVFWQMWPAACVFSHIFILFHFLFLQVFYPETSLSFLFTFNSSRPQQPQNIKKQVFKMNGWSQSLLQSASVHWHFITPALLICIRKLLKASGRQLLLDCVQLRALKVLFNQMLHAKIHTIFVSRLLCFKRDWVTLWQTLLLRICFLQ